MPPSARAADGTSKWRMAAWLFAQFTVSKTVSLKMTHVGLTPPSCLGAARLFGAVQKKNAHHSKVIRIIIIKYYTLILLLFCSS